MIKFGPSGNSEAFYEAGYKHTEQAAEFCRQLNLDCFEYSFGRGILMSEDKAIKIGQAFKDSLGNLRRLTQNKRHKEAWKYRLVIELLSSTVSPRFKHTPTTRFSPQT